MYLHGLTRESVSNMVHCEVRTVSHWKSGRNAMPYAAWWVIRSKVEGAWPD